MQHLWDEELQALVGRIIASGELGRSPTYAAILEYLLACSLAGESPKETSIAVDVLGRESDFDVGKDSTVRVRLYHLRNRLDSYFSGTGADEPWRLVIPKGQYLLQVEPNDVRPATTGRQLTERAPEASVAGVKDRAPGGRRPGWQRALLPLGSAFVAVMMTALVFTGGVFSPLTGDDVRRPERAAERAPWQRIMAGDSPILVVVGDYFIFGELDEAGNIERMVRDFDINSADDLASRYLVDPGLYQEYYNLDLSYVPTGAASALMQIMPVLGDAVGRTRFRLASALTADDIANHNLVYVGYVSGLGLLEEMVFAGSSLSPGRTYDEIQLGDGERVTSNAGLRGRREAFRDYALVSTFPSPQGHQIMLLMGTRDAGLKTVAQALVKPQELDELSERLAGEGVSGQAWEVLYEITGRDGTSFDRRPLHVGELRTERIWSGEF